jgi:hypothetical protein
MDGFDRDVLEMLRGLELLCWSDICQKTKGGDPTNWPRILKAEQCWTSGPPHVAKLFLETMACIRDGLVTAYRKGEEDPKVDACRAAAQVFIHPEPSDPVFLTGLRLPSVSEDCFVVPEELSRHVEPLREDNVQLHLTPKFCNVGLHIGMSTVRDPRR